MKALWLLAAAITIGACANRSEDEVGAALESVPTDSAQGQITSPAPTNEASGMSGDSAKSARFRATVP